MSDLATRLAQLAASGEILTYGALARDLAIPGPGAIAKLTAALETMMRADAQAGRPLRAVLCAGRMGNGLPAPGFFQLAQQLGRFDGSDAAAFVAAERALIWQSAASPS